MAAKNKKDIARGWMMHLCASGRSYHIDDDPSDICWGAPITADEEDEIKENHSMMWDAYDSMDELWDDYSCICETFGLL